MKRYLLRLLKQQLDKEVGFEKNAISNIGRTSDDSFWVKKAQIAETNITKINTYIDILEHTDGRVFSNVAAKLNQP